MKILGDTRFEIDGKTAIIHVPEGIETIRLFHGDSGSVEVTAADGNLEAKVHQPQLQEA